MAELDTFSSKINELDAISTIVDTPSIDEFSEEERARIGNSITYSSMMGTEPNDIFNYTPEINDLVFNNPDEISAQTELESISRKTKITLGEKLKNITAVDILAKLPFSPWLDYKKKAYDYAKTKLREVRSARPKYGMTPMGGYTAMELPFQSSELKQIINDYEEEQQRGQTIPASIAEGVSALPAYMIEFAVGGSAAKELGIASTGIKGIINVSGIRTALQPSRVASSLINQKINGEEGATALLKAYGDVYIENLSEAAGEYALPLLKKMPFGGRLFVQMSKYAKKMGMPESELAKRIGTKVGFNGLVGEWGEERFGSFLRAIFDVEDFGAGKESNIADRMAAALVSDLSFQNQLTELGVLSFPMAGQMILGGMYSDKPVDIEKPVEKAPEAPVTPEQKKPTITEAAEKPTVAPVATQGEVSAKEGEIKKEKVVTKEQVSEEELTPEETKILQAEEAEVVRPSLYIGNVSEGMKRRVAEAAGFDKEDIKGFTEKGWPTKRTEVSLTRGEAEIALEDLSIDLKNRLDNNKIRTENDLAFANAMWGNIAELRIALGIEKGQAPFKVIRSKGQEIKVIKNTKSRIYEAIRPTTESNMTVGEVLRAVVKGKARESKMAYAAGRRELRASIREKARAKKRMNDALKVIKKDIPKSVDYYYREAIEVLREGIDLKTRTEKAKQSLERTKEFLERVPEHEEKMPTELMKRLYKKPLIDYTIEELEQVASEINTLIEQGKLKKQLIQKPIIEQRKKDISEMIDVAERGKAIKEKEVVVNTIKKGFFWSWRPTRILDWLDNRVNFKGKFHDIFYNTPKSAMEKAWRWTDRRIEPGEARLNELGLSPYKLAKHRITINDKKYSLDQMIGVYVFSKNPLSHLALRFGHELSDTDINTIIDNLSEDEKAWGDYMLQEFQNNYERLRTSTIEQENRDPGRQEFYFPMRRADIDYKTLEDEIIKEVLQREGLKRAYAEHGFTLERKHIPPEGQKPIRLEATSIWLSQVKKQEHYMNVGPVVRELNSVLNNSEFNDAIANRGGNVLTKWFRNYVNTIANPNYYRTFDDIENLSRKVRKNSALAYLAFNVVTMAKQLPSVFLYMHEAGVQNLFQSAMEFSLDPIKMIKEVRELDPFVKHRMIERELAELQGIRTGTIGVLHQQVGQYGMEGIYLLDAVARTIGWKAVYNKSINMGLSEKEAIQEARNATLRTQPAAAPIDLPQLYRSSEYLNIFTMFTNQLNQIFNIATYDVPSFIKNEEYGNAALGAIGMSIVATAIWMITNRKPPKEPEDVWGIFSDQAINALPLVGKSIQAKRKGWDTDIPALKAIGTIIGTPIKTLEDLDLTESEWRQLLESLAVITGTPFTQPERIYRAIKEQKPSVLIGGKKQKKKKAKYKL